MKPITLALATTAIAIASSTYVSSAYAGGRGHGLHMHLMQLQHMQARKIYRDDDDHYVRRKRVVITKPAKQVVEKPAPKPVAQVRYIDGEGRQFDQVSKVWFDGEGQCWKGDQAFSFKSGSWFYGNARWIETSAGWGVSSGTAPEMVSCDGIKAFEAKLKTPEAKPVARVETKPAPKVEKIEKAEVAQTETQPEKTGKAVITTPATTAKAGECKKYFPSVGEMVSVPCE
jgi:hypothetical protein